MMAKPQKTSFLTKLVVVFALLFFGVFIYQTSQQAKESKRLSADEFEYRKKITAELKVEKDDVISDATKLIKDGKPEFAIKRIAKYIELHDADIDAIYTDAQVQAITIELKSIPVKEYVKNLSLYKKLSKLKPDAEKYKNKIRFYKEKIESRKAELAEERRQRAIPGWHSFDSKDEMTGDIQFYVNSPKTTPRKKLSSPYSGIEATLGVGCDNEDQWAYINFSIKPNLLNSDTKDGYDEIKTRVKWDEEVSDLLLTQTWGSEFVHFTADREIINKLKTSKKLLLELRWYGNETAHFDFSLKKANEEISSITKSCDELI